MTYYKSQCVGFYKYHDYILGKGSFATVYLARHKIIGCDVALKVINIDDIKEEYSRKNLYREACILRDLQHPNIIRLYEVIKSYNLYCLAMEVVRGVNLFQYMRNIKSRMMPEKVARTFFVQMLSGVEYMHRVHIIHRDLKLENILVEFGHVIKIVDFGLSNVYYPTYILRTRCGSLEYAAPELFNSTAIYGENADVWSLGVILYAMVVGKMPFKLFQKNNQDGTLVNSQETPNRKDRFVKRVSKGLMQDNWEQMNQLSSECWDLLHEMLEPDQFRRIHVERAIIHPWIRKDENLKKRLPQSRRELERKFYSEVVNYLAPKLNTSTSRIENHIKVDPFGKIAAMFNIARDTLIKESLYPPQKFQSSFLYRFESARPKRSKLCYINQTYNNYEKEMPKKYDTVTNQECTIKNNKKTNNEEETSSQYISTLPSKASDNDEISPTSNDFKMDPHENNLSPSLKNVHNQKEQEKYPPKIHRKFVIFENSVDPNTKQHIEEPKQAFQNAYRSYKNSRPKTIGFQNSKDKNVDGQSVVKHHTGNQSVGENLCEKDYKGFQFPKGNTQTEENERLKKLFKNNEIGAKRPIISCSVEPNKRISKIMSKSKLREPSCIEERDCHSETTPGKSTTATSNDVTSFKRKSEEISRSKKNSTNPVEFAESQIKKKNISILTRSHQPSNRSKDKKEDALKGLELPGRMPIKNFRFGKSSPYSKTPNAEKNIPSKKTPVVDRINLCRGDTKERDS